MAGPYLIENEWLDEKSALTFLRDKLTPQLMKLPNCRDPVWLRKFLTSIAVNLTPLAQHKLVIDDWSKVRLLRNPTDLNTFTFWYQSKDAKHFVQLRCGVR